MSAMFVHAAPADLSSHHEAAKPDPALAIRQAQQSHDSLHAPLVTAPDRSQSGEDEH